MYDADKQSVENGIAPSLPASLSDADAKRGLDSIIEAARRAVKGE